MDRPASTRVVLASLPGGDQLEAALLAGETPSPEMVAAAANVGDLRPAVAWVCLVAGILGLLSIPVRVPERPNWDGHVPPRGRPEHCADA